MENKLFIPTFENMSDISKNKQEFVLQDWVGRLNFKQQTGLISAIRGCDYKEEEGDTEGCSFKDITKMVRGIVLKNADTSTKFMSDRPLDRSSVLDTLVQYSKFQECWHWLNHIVMAMYSIANYHNNDYVKMYYLELCTEYSTRLKHVEELLEDDSIKSTTIQDDLNKVYNIIDSSNDSDNNDNILITGSVKASSMLNVVESSGIHTSDKLKVVYEEEDKNYPSERI